MKRLIETARGRGIESMHSSDATDNEALQKFTDHLKFHHQRDPDDARQVLYSVDLRTATA
jgi:hypothetical protein